MERPLILVINDDGIDAPGLRSLIDTIREIGKVVVGQEEVVESVLISFMCDGHVLLEGAPGLAKTLLIKTLAAYPVKDLVTESRSLEDIFLKYYESDPGEVS